MISPDLRIEHLNGEQLENLLRLMDPPADASDGATTTLRGEALRWLDRLTSDPVAPREDQATDHTPPVLLVLRGGRPVRARRLGGEPVALAEFGDGSPAALRAFRQRDGAAFVLAVQSEALPGLAADLQSAIRPGTDLVSQALSAARLVQERGRTALFVEPEAWGRWRLPSYELVQGSFEKLLPHGTTLVFYVQQRGKLWTSLIARQRHGDIDLITSHDAIAAEAPFRGIQDAPQVLTTVQRRIGPPHIGAFVGLGSWQRFVAGDRGALARAIAAREAVLDPCPAWLLAVVGAGAVSEAATRSARLAGKLLAKAPIGGRLFGESDSSWRANTQKIATKIANPLDALGLDPWELVRWGREWTRRFRYLVDRR